MLELTENFGPRLVVYSNPPHQDILPILHLNFYFADMPHVPIPDVFSKKIKLKLIIFQSLGLQSYMSVLKNENFGKF